MEDVEQVKRDIENRIAGLREELNYNPWFFLKWRTDHINKQIDYTRAQASKITAWIDTHNQLTLLKERFEHSQQLERINFQAQAEGAIALVEAQKLNRKLIGLADEMGIDLVNYGLVRKEQLMTDVLINRKRQHDQLEVEKHAQLKEIDFQYLKEETQMKLKYALAYQQISFEQVEFFLGKINALVQQRHELQFSGQPIQLIQPQINNYNLVIDGWVTKLGRLVQSDNGEDLRGGDEDTVGRGEHRKGLGGRQIQIPTEDSGDE